MILSCVYNGYRCAHYIELLRSFTLQISMLDDTLETDDCGRSQSGYDSPVLLDHNCSADESGFSSLLLEEVDLRGNCLRTVPSWLFMRFQYLRRLDASQNQIDSLPLAAWSSTSLVELTLSNNRLSCLSSAHLEPVHLQLDGDPDQLPGTPVSCASDGSQPSDLMTTPSTTDQQHQSLDILHLERWRDRIDVRPVSYVYDGSSARSSLVEHRKSHLKELDLSHNKFEDVPSILPCVAPSLERLNLSHNRLTRFGPVDCFPASLRLLDLSHNRIAAMDLAEDCHIGTSSTTTPVSIPTPSPFSPAFRPCHSPLMPKRFIIIILLRCGNLLKRVHFLSQHVGVLKYFTVILCFSVCVFYTTTNSGFIIPLFCGLRC